MPTKYNHNKNVINEQASAKSKIQSGDIVFFPDDLEHYVPKSETDKPRLTVAFTVSKH